METIVSIAEMSAFAQRFVEGALAARGEDSSATVIALSGDLGAGKTTFTQALARALGVTESVSSPTFIVMKRYPLSHARFDNLVHIDAYRLDDERDAAALKLEDVLRDPRNLVVVEWAERIPSYIPHDAIAMTFAHADGEARTVRYDHA